MPVSKEQAAMLASLASACRPHGAPAWDAPGIVAAIGKVKHLALADVMRAVANAADDRNANTPGVLTNLGSPCWQDRPVRPPATEVLDPAERCGVCSERRDRCRALWHDDHAFEPGFIKHDGSYEPRIIEAVKGEVAPTPVVETKTLDDLLPTERNPHAAAAREAMTTQPTPAPTDERPADE